MPERDRAGAAQPRASAGTLGAARVAFLRASVGEVLAVLAAVACDAERQAVVDGEALVRRVGPVLDVVGVDESPSTTPAASVVVPREHCPAPLAQLRSEGSASLAARGSVLPSRRLGSAHVRTRANDRAIPLAVAIPKGTTAVEACAGPGAYRRACTRAESGRGGTGETLDDLAKTREAL